MSTKTEAKNKNQNNLENNADDDWDDWGDAEENFSDVEDNNTIKEPVAAKVQNEISKEEHIEKIEKNADNSNTKVKLNNDQAQQQATTTSWWGGLTSVLTTATEGLGNITSTVSQGLNQVIGVPDPEEMARLNVAEAAKTTKIAQDVPAENANEEQDESAAAFGKTIVSGVTTLGSKVLNTGLDTLEGIGKKTMHILQENDPLLKNKRKLLGLEHDRPNLSEVLKEAKKDAEELENTLKELKITKNQQQHKFEILFEHNCGLVHLEAIEILSQESTLKLQSLMNSVSGKALTDLQETINEVKELMELDDTDAESEGDYTAAQLKQTLTTAIEDLELDITFEDFADNWQHTLDWLETNDAVTAQIIFEQSITRLAEACALAMNKLHKIAELLLVKDHHSTASEVDSIVQLCHEFIVHLHGLTHRFACRLTGLNDEEAKTKLNTLCGELLLAVQQVEKSFKLFLPIIQIGAA